MEAGNELDLFSTVRPGDSWLKRKFISFVEKFTKLDDVYALYEKYQANLENYKHPADFIIEQLNLELDYADPPALKDNKPLLIISNHPSGLLDGTILAHIASKTRKFHIVSHVKLTEFSIFEYFILGIDIIGRDRTTMLKNACTKKTTIETLKQGGCVILYPYGGMQIRKKELFRKTPRLIPDAKQIKEVWGLMTANIIHKAQCDVLLVYFSLKPYTLFSLASKISSRLSHALFIRESFSHKNSKITIRFGDLIQYKQIAHIKDRIDLTIHLRQKMLELSNTPTA